MPLKVTSRVMSEKTGYIPLRDQEGKRGGTRAELGPFKLPLMILMLFIQKTDTAAPPRTRGSLPTSLHAGVARGQWACRDRQGQAPRCLWAPASDLDQLGRGPQSFEPLRVPGLHWGSGRLWAWSWLPAAGGAADGG